MHGDWMSWGGGMWFSPGMMILWFAFIILVIFWLVRAITGGGRGAAERRSEPREILDERYARGEIDKQEYEEKRKTLGV